MENKEINRSKIIMNKAYKPMVAQILPKVIMKTAIEAEATNRIVIEVMQEILELTNEEVLAIITKYLDEHDAEMTEKVEQNIRDKKLQNFKNMLIETCERFEYVEMKIKFETNDNRKEKENGKSK